jgi:hypothetical protein
MPTDAYEPLATQTLGSAQSSITFSSISQSYTDLVLINNCIGSSDRDVYGQVNGDTANNYSLTTMYGYGTNIGGGISFSYNQFGGAGRLQTTGSATIINFMNYSNTTTYKTFLSRVNNSGFAMQWVNVWRSTSAITSILLYPASGTFSTGSTFTLYGIKAA